MAKFITTIRLHNAEVTDYEKLDAELGKRSFKGTVNYSKQKKEIIKEREYNRDGNVTLQEVTDAVVKAAGSTGKKYSFTIIRNKPIRFPVTSMEDIP